MALKFIDQIEVKGKRVIARFDFNVPLSKDGKGKILDTTRIDMALPTIRFLLEQGVSRLTMMGHLGRPNGKQVKELSLAPIAEYLAEKLGSDVILTENCTDRGIKTLLDLPTTKLVLLENLRFHKEETNNDFEFAKKLAFYGDIYVNDAFGTLHRKHASTYAINAYFKNKNVAGFLVRNEFEALTKITNKPQKPFMTIMGGAKVNDKIKIINRLLPIVDKLIIGGAMAYPFLAAKGYDIGKSLCSDQDITLAKKLLNEPAAQKMVFPIDHLIAESPNETPSETSSYDIPEDKMGLDIGPKTIEHFKSTLASAKTILWNGPMGFFENENFSKGTFAIAKTLANLSKKDGVFTLIGGGDSVSAVKKSGLAEEMGHVSTGGGATLEFIEKGNLPGLEALKYGVEL